MLNCRYILHSRQRNVQKCKGTLLKILIRELWFLYSSLSRNVLPQCSRYQYMKFHLNTLNDSLFICYSKEAGGLFELRTDYEIVICHPLEINQKYDKESYVYLIHILSCWTCTRSFLSKFLGFLIFSRNHSNVRVTTTMQR